MITEGHDNIIWILCRLVASSSRGSLSFDSAKIPGAGGFICVCLKKKKKKVSGIYALNTCLHGSVDSLSVVLIWQRWVLFLFFLLFFFFTVRQSCLKFHCENRSLILCTDYCFCSALFSSLLIPGMVQTFLKGLTQLCWWRRGFIGASSKSLKGAGER